MLHLVILYGSPWNSGVDQHCDKCLSLWPTLSVALLMQILMIGLAVAYCKIDFGKFWAKLPICELIKRPCQEQKAAPPLPHKISNDAELH